MEKFNEIISSPTPVLVDFFAEWCGPCKAMKPILEKLKSEIDESVRIIKIDIDKQADLANAYNIQSVPTLIIFKSGEPVWRASGVKQVSDLKDIIKQHL